MVSYTYSRHIPVAATSKVIAMSLRDQISLHGEIHRLYDTTYTDSQYAMKSRNALESSRGPACDVDMVPVQLLSSLARRRGRCGGRNVSEVARSRNM